MSNSFPDDANGDVLRRMQEGGDALTQPRDIDFSLVFPEEEAAQDFARQSRRLGFKSVVAYTGTKPETSWDATATKQMLPTHAAIGESEAELQDLASPLGGVADGWGCFRIVTKN